MTRINPASLEWKLTRAEIDEQIERAMTALEDATDPPIIYRLQGRIQGLRALIAEIEDTDEIAPSHTLY